MKVNYQRFNPCQTVVFRGLGYSKIWYALPAIVVQDTPDLTALFWCAGTPEKWRGKSPDEKVTPQTVMLPEMKLFDRLWTETDVLMLVPAGAAHAVYVMWDEGQKALRCWYINLQQPLARTAIGFDTQDYWLDIVICPDRSEWHWKDEDQFNEVTALGMYSPEQAREIRAEGERAVRRVQTNQPPFCEGWENWRAPEDWVIPTFPEGWDHL